MAINDIKIFGGSASPKLTKAICDYLGVSPGLMIENRISVVWIKD